MQMNCGDKVKLSGGSGLLEDREGIGGAGARSLIWNNTGRALLWRAAAQTLGRSVHFISSLPEVEPLVS